MTNNHATLPHHTTANGRRAQRASANAARRVRTQLVSDAVVSSYINDISGCDRSSLRPPRKRA
jgi:hypothetical protein